MLWVRSLSDIAEEKDLQHAQAEIDRVFQSGRGGFLPDALVLLKSKNSKSVEAGVLQRQPVFGGIHAEAAGAAGTRGEIEVAVDDFLPGHAFGFQVPEILNQGCRK